MKTTPMLFRPEMVNAIISGNKTQTTQVIDPQPTLEDFGIAWSPNKRNGLVAVWATNMPLKIEEFSPYGKPGDLLWLRETWQALPEYDHLKPSDIPIGSDILYVADRPDMLWDTNQRPSIFMPRWASRITLEITDIRVERLQDISEEDCSAEGILECDGMFCDVQYLKYCKEMGCVVCDLKPMYRQLWESINGAGSWDANPWVWAISFKHHMMNIDQFIQERKAA